MTIARSKAFGVASAGASFGIWSLYALMWAQLKSVGAVPLEILAHRVLWAHLFCWLTLVALGRRAEAPGAIWPQSARVWLLCAFNGALNTANWLVCIWAATSGHLIEASLGYFMAPVMAAALGLLVFRERLTPLQRLALYVAAATVACALVFFGRAPWIPLLAGGTAAGYAALRKHIPVPAISGTIAETAALVPVAGAYLFLTHGRHGEVFGSSLFASGLCLGAGLMTALALLFYATAARRLRLATLGIMQYAYPVSQLLVGLWIFHETFDAESTWMLAGSIASVTLYSLGGLEDVFGWVRPMARWRG